MPHVVQQVLLYCAESDERQRPLFFKISKTAMIPTGHVQNVPKCLVLKMGASVVLALLLQSRVFK